MNLTPREKDKLLVSLAAMVARARLARGVKLNHPETIALITDFVVEGARDGRSVADLMEVGRPCRHARAGDGRHFRNDPRRAGGGDVPRRNEACHRPQSRRVEEGAHDTRRDHHEGRRHRPQRGPRDRDARPSPTPATGQSRSARTIISSRPTARCPSSATRRGAFASTSRLEPPCASSPARRARCASSPCRARASSTGSSKR